MSIAEIADAMDLKENTVKSHLFRARNLLKERLADYGQSSVHLRWMKDGIAYVLAIEDLSDPEGHFKLLETIDIETMIEILIAIAESI